MIDWVASESSPDFAKNKDKIRRRYILELKNLEYQRMNML